MASIERMAESENTNIGGGVAIAKRPQVDSSDIEVFINPNSTPQTQEGEVKVLEKQKQRPRFNLFRRTPRQPSIQTLTPNSETSEPDSSSRTPESSGSSGGGNNEENRGGGGGGGGEGRDRGPEDQRGPERIEWESLSDKDIVDITSDLEALLSTKKRNGLSEARVTQIRRELDQGYVLFQKRFEDVPDNARIQEERQKLDRELRSLPEPNLWVDLQRATDRLAVIKFRLARGDELADPDLLTNAQQTVDNLVGRIGADKVELIKQIENYIKLNVGLGETQGKEFNKIENRLKEKDVFIEENFDLAEDESVDQIERNINAVFEAWKTNKEDPEAIKNLEVYLMEAHNRGLLRLEKNLFENLYKNLRDKVKVGNLSYDDLEILEELQTKIEKFEAEFWQASPNSKFNGIKSIYAQLASDHLRYFILTGGQGSTEISDRGYLRGEWNLGRVEERLDKEDEEVLRYREPFAGSVQFEVRNKRELRQAVSQYLRHIQAESVRINIEDTFGSLKALGKAIDTYGQEVGMDSEERLTLKRESEYIGWASVAQRLVRDGMTAQYAQWMEYLLDKDGPERLDAGLKYYNGKHLMGLHIMEHSPKFYRYFNPEGSRGQLLGNEGSQIYYQNNMKQLLIDRLMGFELMGDAVEEREFNRSMLTIDQTEGEFLSKYIDYRNPQHRERLSERGKERWDKIHQILEKYDKGEELTKEEKAVLDPIKEEAGKAADLVFQSLDTFGQTAKYAGYKIEADNGDLVVLEYAKKAIKYARRHASEIKGADGDVEKATRIVVAAIRSQGFDAEIGGKTLEEIIQLEEVECMPNNYLAIVGTPRNEMLNKRELALRGGGGILGRAYRIISPDGKLVRLKDQEEERIQVSLAVERSRAEDEDALIIIYRDFADRIISGMRSMPLSLKPLYNYPADLLVRRDHKVRRALVIAPYLSLNVFSYADDMGVPDIRTLAGLTNMQSKQRVERGLFAGDYWWLQQKAKRDGAAAGIIALIEGDADKEGNHQDGMLEKVLINADSVYTMPTTLTLEKVEEIMDKLIMPMMKKWELFYDYNDLTLETYRAASKIGAARRKNGRIFAALLAWLTSDSDGTENLYMERNKVLTSVNKGRLEGGLRSYSDQALAIKLLTNPEFTVVTIYDSASGRNREVRAFNDAKTFMERWNQKART